MASWQLTIDPGSQVEAFLEEMLVLCSRSEEYNLWILRSLAVTDSPELLAGSTEQQKVFRSGPFNVLLRQLIAYYINMVRLAPRMPAVHDRVRHVQLADCCLRLPCFT